MCIGSIYSIEWSSTGTEIFWAILRPFKRSNYTSIAVKEESRWICLWTGRENDIMVPLRQRSYCTILFLKRSALVRFCPSFFGNLASLFTVLAIYENTAANFWMPHHLLSNNSLSSVYENSVKNFNNFKSFQGTVQSCAMANLTTINILMTSHNYVLYKKSNQIYLWLHPGHSLGLQELVVSLCSSESSHSAALVASVR